MKTISKKVIAIVLSAIMVLTTIPFTVTAATADGTDVSALETAITAYQTKMNTLNGSRVFTNMSTAYDKYVVAKSVLDGALYGHNEVSQSDITSAASALTTATNNMSEWAPYKATYKPTYAFGDEANSASYNATNAANAYAYGYNSVIWTQSSVSSGSGSWTTANCTMTPHIPNAVLLYNGVDTASVGAMFGYKGASNKNRKIYLMSSNNANFYADDWFQCAKDDGNNKNAHYWEDKWIGTDTYCYQKLDYGPAYTWQSTDITAGNSGNYGNVSGSRSMANSTAYMAGRIRFISDSNFENENMASYTSINWSSYSGDGNPSDSGSGNTTINIKVINYAKLVNAIKTAAKDNLRVSSDNPYYQGGLASAIDAIEAAMNWNPTTAYTIDSATDSDINSLASDIGTKTAQMQAVSSTADPATGYTELRAAITNATSKYNNAVADAAAGYETYTQTSVDNYITLYEAAQAIFDNNVAGATSESHYTNSTGAASAAAALAAAKLESNEEKVDVTQLLLDIIEIEAALKNRGIIGLNGQRMTNAQYGEISDALDACKTQIWPGEGGYDDEAALLAANQRNQNRVTTQQGILEGYINQFTTYELGTVKVDTEDIVDETTGEVTVQDVNHSLNSIRAALEAVETDKYANGADVLSFLNSTIPAYNNQVIIENVTAIDGSAVLNKLAAYSKLIKDGYYLLTHLVGAFTATPNGTHISDGTWDTSIDAALNGATSGDDYRWRVQFSRYNNPVVLQTTHADPKMDLGRAEITFLNNNGDFSAQLDSINLNAPYNAQKDITNADLGNTFFNLWDTVTGGESGAFGDAWLKTDDTAEDAKNYDNPHVDSYPGGLSIGTNGGGIYAIENIYATYGTDVATITNDDGSTSDVRCYGSDPGVVSDMSHNFTNALGTTQGTIPTTGGLSAAKSGRVIAEGKMTLQLPSTTVTLTRDTYPSTATYSASGKFGALFYYGYNSFAFFGNARHACFGTAAQTYSQSIKVIDIANLFDLINQCSTTDYAAENYTAASYNAFAAALDAAKANDFNPTTAGTQSYIDVYNNNGESYLLNQLKTRYQNLWDARNALVRSANNKALTDPTTGALVNTLYSNQIAAGQQHYTNKSWNAFKTAYYTARSAALDEDQTANGVAANVKGIYTNANVRNYAGYKYHYTYNNNDSSSYITGVVYEDATGANVDSYASAAISDDQAAINKLATDLASAYAGLVEWADFSGLKQAYDNLGAQLEDNVYTTTSLQSINTAFATSTFAKSYYNVVAAGAAVTPANLESYQYYADDRFDAATDQAAIDAETAAINAITLTAPENIEIYTAQQIIANVLAVAEDPDAYDTNTSTYLAAAQQAADAITSNVAISAYNTTVSGIAYDNQEAIDTMVRGLVELQPMSYNVQVTAQDGTVTNTTYPYGTTVTLHSPDGEAANWSYTYTSNTSGNQNEQSVYGKKDFEFVVKGNTQIHITERTQQNSVKVTYMTSFYKIVRVDYVEPNSTITVNTSTVDAPAYAFYTFDGTFRHDGNSATSLDVNVGTEDTRVYLDYSALPDRFTERTLNILWYKDGEMQTVYEGKVKWNDRVEVTQDGLTVDKSVYGTTAKQKKAPKYFYVNDEQVSMTDLTIYMLNTNITPFYGFTIVPIDKLAAWKTNRTKTFYDEENPSANVEMVGASGVNSFATRVDESMAIIIYSESDFNSEYAKDVVNKGDENGAAVYTATKPIYSYRDVEFGGEICEETYKYSTVNRFVLPENATLVEAGMLWTYTKAQRDENGDADVPELPATELTLANVGKSGIQRFKSTKHTVDGQYTMSVKTTSFSENSYDIRTKHRAYMIYKLDGDETLHTVYSNTVEILHEYEFYCE